MKKILILGGGFGGVQFYKIAHKKLHGSPNIVFQMISRQNYFLFYPMLHEVATGSVERSHIVQPLREIIDCCLESFMQEEVEFIDVDKKFVKTLHSKISYDYLLISLGAEPNYFNIPGAKENCVSFKSVQNAAAVRSQLITCFERAAHEKDAKKRKEFLSFSIVGGGPVGVELAGQIADLIRNEIKDLYAEVDIGEVSINLIDSSDRLLRMYHPELSREAQKRLESHGVRVLLNARVSKCDEGAVYFDDGTSIRGKLRIWSAGNKSAVKQLFEEKYLTDRGGIKTTSTLQMIGHPEVFVVGDNMEIVDDAAVRIPQTAQAASAAAEHAAQNFVAMVSNGPLKPFYFESKGDIIPIGDWFAVAELGSFRFFGKIAWVLRRLVFINRLNSKVNRLKVTIDWILALILRRDTSEL